MFVFPNAPIGLGGGSQAWWMIEHMISLFQTALPSGNLSPIVKYIPGGFQDSSDKLMATITRIVERYNLEYTQLVIGGFSQGAIISTDVVLRLFPENAGALAIFSGILMCSDIWREGLEKKQGLKIIQSHGSQDMVLPFMLGNELKKLFESSDVDYSFVQFQGDHSIPPEVYPQYYSLLD
eukprot:TRINITY_DN1667_c0_g1_i2.p1 TRINITY_DN1667_c0_g1~~TRINITY_DN1667_c0_g1_i2.p1  ORF type:complete len:180 (-),score=34.50 TRINITY_DN1667_c0_g1_i2:34-573(-)